MRTIGLLCLLAVGCVTQYQPSGWGGGYADSQLAERVFDIAFAGNGWTHQSTVEAYALRRAAEIAVSRGFVGFVEMRDNTSAHQSVSYTEKTSYATGKSYQEPHVTTSHLTKKRIYLVTAEEMRELPAAIDARIILGRWGIVPPTPTPAPVLAKPNWDAPAPKVTE